MAEIKNKAARDMESTLSALLTQPTLPEAAKAAGVSCTTLWRRLKDPVLQAAYRDARRESMGQARAQLQQIATSAVTTLQNIMEDPKVSPAARVAAARTVLEMAQRSIETEDFQERLAAIEGTLQQMPSPEDDWKNWAVAYRNMEFIEDRMPANLDLQSQIQFRALAAAFSPGERERIDAFSATQPNEQILVKDFPPDLTKAGNRFVTMLDEISLFLTGKPWLELVGESNAGLEQVVLRQSLSPEESPVDDGRKETPERSDEGSGTRK